jgi:hypothetical protein
MFYNDLYQATSTTFLDLIRKISGFNHIRSRQHSHMNAVNTKQNKRKQSLLESMSALSLFLTSYLQR